MSDTKTLVKDFVKKQRKLIEIEYEAEKEKTDVDRKVLVSQGLCIQNLKSLRTVCGLQGRILITFTRNLRYEQQLGAHKITCGDNVSIEESGGGNTRASGVVRSINSYDITVALERESNESLDEGLDDIDLIKKSYDVTYRRLKDALNEIRFNWKASPLVDLLIGCRLPGSLKEIEPFEFINLRLDDSQKEAVTFALQSRDLCIIHGPPGTGKTTTIVEVILQLVKKGRKVLVCAPSNIAIDNLVEKLASFDVRNMIRLGDPARASSDIQWFTLDAVIDRTYEMIFVKKIRYRIDILRRSQDRSNLAQIQNLLFDMKRQELRIYKQVLRGCDIVLSTLVTSSSDGPLQHLGNPGKYFDVLIIDECSQAIEVACWIPLTLVKKCILAGDHYQLPPTVITKTAAKKDLELSLMERLLSRFDHEKVVRMLTVQYRMHKKIMEWPSQSFYSNKLTAHQSVENQSMSEISNLSDCPPLLLIDTAGCDMQELYQKSSVSNGNEYEASIAAIYVDYLIDKGVKPQHIGIITPYNLQIELIKLRLHRNHPDVEIRSVDGFQGREKEVIILSLVRSNAKKATGFLREYRRINVAVTRAKKHLVVICDSDTVSAETHISSLIDHLKINGKVKSAYEYLKSKRTRNYHQPIRKRIRFN
ncbi:DNA-binding protein SMUBP-2-like [Panonychus citri]|uniref:DNA-binding protein SMUBP-2-like n=1 Tax=Panonychus citri TaxID=50023 RepID=UPI0023070EAC|nr:DNA-binding protein SMUBP-2-like [Panonychus citri]